MKTNHWNVQLKILLSALLFLSSPVWAQKENKHIRQGNDQYMAEKYKDAEVDYMKALEKSPESVKGQYNLGGALYKQDNFEDAEKLYSSIASREMDKQTQAKAHYNLGNTLLKEKKYEDAVESYKNSLRLNPDDMDAKYNLELAKRMLQQQQQKDQDKNKDDKKDKKDKKDQKDKQNQDKQDQNKDKQDQQNKDQQNKDQQDKQDQKGEQNKQQQQAQPQQISKKDAERMLQALKNDENKTLEKVKLKQVPAKTKKNEKDW